MSVEVVDRSDARLLLSAAGETAARFCYIFTLIVSRQHFVDLSELQNISLKDTKTIKKINYLLIQ